MDDTEASKYSEDRKYRYLSRQRIGQSDRKLLFIMLNPATTEATEDSPNRRRQTRTHCINFAKRWGYGILTVANLFAFRAPNAKELFKAADPVGPDNDRWICEAVKSADKVVLAWGTYGAKAWGPGGSNKDRSAEVVAMVTAIKVPYYLVKTKNGQPGNPSRVPVGTELIPWA